jgi:hypothetical protein
MWESGASVVIWHFVRISVDVTCSAVGVRPYEFSFLILIYIIRRDRHSIFDENERNKRKFAS